MHGLPAHVQSYGVMYKHGPFGSPLLCAPSFCKPWQAWTSITDPQQRISFHQARAGLDGHASPDPTDNHQQGQQQISSGAHPSPLPTILARQQQRFPDIAAKPQPEHGAGAQYPYPLKYAQMGHSRFGRGSPHLCYSQVGPTGWFYIKPDDADDSSKAVQFWQIALGQWLQNAIAFVDDHLWRPARGSSTSTGIGASQSRHYGDVSNAGMLQGKHQPPAWQRLCSHIVSWLMLAAALAGAATVATAVLMAAVSKQPTLSAVSATFVRTMLAAMRPGSCIWMVLAAVLSLLYVRGKRQGRLY